MPSQIESSEKKDEAAAKSDSEQDKELEKIIAERKANRNGKPAQAR